MSLNSSMSNLSVSFRGNNEADLEQSLDIVFRELQENLNTTHCVVRSLAMSSEQDADYKEETKMSFQMNDCVDDMQTLFKELKTVVKQLVGKPPTDADKTWLKSFEIMHKQERADEKKRNCLEEIKE